MLFITAMLSRSFISRLSLINSITIELKRGIFSATVFPQRSIMYLVFKSTAPNGPNGRRNGKVLILYSKSSHFSLLHCHLRFCCSWRFGLNSLMSWEIHNHVLQLKVALPILPIQIQSLDSINPDGRVSFQKPWELRKMSFKIQLLVQQFKAKRTLPMDLMTLYTKIRSQTIHPLKTVLIVIENSVSLEWNIIAPSVQPSFADEMDTLPIVSQVAESLAIASAKNACLQKSSNTKCTNTNYNNSIIIPIL